jgi:hypothetical protein
LETFAEAMAALAETCGEKLLIKLGDNLYALISCDFVPGSSIASHVAKFQSLYTSLKSDLVGNENMKVSTTMAGIFFFKSFRNDESLSALIQNMYDMVPFSFEKLAARMNIENSRTESLTAGTVNAVAPKSSLLKPNKEKFKAIPTSQRFWNVVPTKGCPSQNSNQPSSSSTLSNSEIQRLIEQQIQVLKKLQVNNVEEDEDNNFEVDKGEVDAVDEYHLDDPDDTGFFVNDKDSVQVVSHNLAGTCLILDTGASKSTVSNQNILYNMKPVMKHMKTYSGAINITHTGTMKFGIYNIHPVYYAPAGKCNLISVSQLEDHGFRVYHKNKMFLVYMGARIVKRFPRVGDLYVSTISNPPVVNSLLAMTKKDTLKDWHIILGHPSDLYVNKFLDIFNIKKSIKTGLSINCEVCRMAKLKSSSHSNPLPSAKSPFSVIHMDVLQVTPVLRGSFRYILVLIDDYLRYNQIYLL